MKYKPSDFWDVGDFSWNYVVNIYMIRDLIFISMLNITKHHAYER